MGSLTMGATQGSSGIGNTSLRGFGGMASGLDRDALIEQMTKGTQAKLTKARQESTRIEWKQEAFRSLSDKTLDLQDDFLSYSSRYSLKNSDLYSTNLVDTRGDSAATKFITARGASEMSKNLKIAAVTKLATAESVVSDVKGTVTAIKTGISLNAMSGAKKAKISNLKGTSLQFGNYDTTGAFTEKTRFTFPASYTDENGKTVEIDYTGDKQKLVQDLNKAAKQAGVKLGEHQDLKFKYNPGATPGNDFISIEGSSEYVIKTESSALEALGYEAGHPGATSTGSGSAAYGLGLNHFNAGTAAAHKFTQKSLKETDYLDYLADKKISINFGATRKDVSILTQQQLNQIKAASTDPSTRLNAVKAAMQENIDHAFGNGKIRVDRDTDHLTLNSVNGKDTVTVNAADKIERDNLGIQEGSSNRVSVSSSIMSNLDKLGLGSFSGNKAALDTALSHLKINGKEVKGLSSDMTVSEMLKKINDAEVGVRASYMEGSGRFVLVSSETGSGRTIDLGNTADPNNVAAKIFGATASGGGQINHGEDAELVYNYGNGINEIAHSSSNTFNIDGLEITASGKFGVEFDSSGNPVTRPDGSYNYDTSKTVSFSSKANVEKAATNMKKFIEKYNELVSEVNSAVRTRREKGVDPLTEEQKKQMSETSIENWEKKAKQGVLYGESSIRNYSMSLSSVMTKMMGDLEKAGLSYTDMEEAGITMSSDFQDGGKLVFDEEKFKKAMETHPEKIEKMMTGYHGSKGLVKIVEETVTPYATRFSSKNGGSYGELIKQAGSNRMSYTNLSSVMHEKLKENAEKIEKIKALLSTEQDRYIKQFSQLEQLISKMNAQASYLSGLNN